MNIFEFGDAKLRALDIDPIYTALWRAQLPREIRQRFAIAETAFDHSGVAADIAQEDDFWKAMRWGVKQKLRGGSRRYFRSTVAFESLKSLRQNYPSYKNMFCAMQGTFQQILARRNTFPQFGPRAIFKLADMAERLCSCEVDFTQVTMEEMCNNVQVLKGAQKACAVLKIELHELLPALQSYRWATKASPLHDRPLNQQEFETMLCYYSHSATHMPGMDALDKKKELERGTGWLAQLLIKHLPKGTK